MKSNKHILITVILLLAIAGLTAGIYVGHHWLSKPKINVSEFHGTYLEHPRTVNPFNLTGTDDKPFNNNNLSGRWTILFFGFTNCGYLCPTTMAEVGKMYRILENKNIKNLPQVVMVSIDPERDNLDKLKKYVRSFHPEFQGARGDEDVIKSLTKEMGVAYAKVYEKDNKQSENYDIQHSGALMLFNPQGELNAFFTSPHHADSLAKDYLLLVS